MPWKSRNLECKTQLTIKSLTWIVSLSNSITAKQSFSGLPLSIFAVWLTDFLLDASILHQLSSTLRRRRKQIRKLWQSQKSIREEMEENFFSTYVSVDAVVKG